MLSKSKQFVLHSALVKSSDARTAIASRRSRSRIRHTELQVQRKQNLLAGHNIAYIGKSLKGFRQTAVTSPWQFHLPVFTTSSQMAIHCKDLSAAVGLLPDQLRNGVGRTNLIELSSEGPSSYNFPSKPCFSKPSRNDSMTRATFASVALKPRRPTLHTSPAEAPRPPEISTL